ncbi:hypothetical protein D4764_10G0008230 [Takifugu flavidus]|uniref:Uncharacterized protein n=1 Tax=Takifugu flavidus TaxID=433684 RepID=A0A5C6PKE0_9TELE|nr:hypothetical protein D4764_10G0008230 [Takifugu flavidus]
MKDTRGQRGASWTPPEEKMIDPNPPTPHPSIITSNVSSPHQCLPEPFHHASQSAPSTTCVSLGCVTQGGRQRLEKPRPSVWRRSPRGSGHPVLPFTACARTLPHPQQPETATEGKNKNQPRSDTIEREGRGCEEERDEKIGEGKKEKQGM